MFLHYLNKAGKDDADQTHSLKFNILTTQRFRFSKDNKFQWTRKRNRILLILEFPSVRSLFSTKLCFLLGEILDF